jgi:hypothetical protein
MTSETLRRIVDTPGVQRLQTSDHTTIPDGLRWLETLVADYRKILLNEPFYQIATTATTIRDFAWARQLLHHSTKFPQVLALRRDLNNALASIPNSWYWDYTGQQTNSTPPAS